MNKQSLIKNYIYQFMYQAIIILVPFILSPYLTRTLQETALGTYTFVNSVAYYFLIAANLGIGVHGKRIISRNSEDNESLRKTFWSLFTLHAIISIISILAYMGYILFFVHEFKSIYYIEFFYVASALFDITWLFYGLENFRNVVIRNTIVKISECALIFLLVKTPSDLSKYTMIVAGGILAGQIVMLPQAIKIVKPIRFGKQDIKQHIRPLLIFSIALVATSLYTVFDKTLLGVMATIESVAFYEYANKIITIPKTFSEVTSTVMFPRACKLAAKGEVEEQKKYMNYSFLVTAFIGMGSLFGIMSIAEPFATIYYGDSFSSCGKIMIALAPLVYIVGAGKILRSQCLIPNGKDKEFNICIVLNAIVNLVFSIVLIPIIGIYGAVVGTLMAEMFGFVYQFILSRKYISIKDVLKTLIPFVFLGFVMFLVIKVVRIFVDPYNVSGLLINVLIGGVFYCILSIGYFYVFEKEIVIEMLNAIKRNKQQQ